jgi:hypothetical protein
MQETLAYDREMKLKQMKEIMSGPRGRSPQPPRAGRNQSRTGDSDLAQENGAENTMTRTFNLDTTVGPASLLASARRAAHENGATLVGDERSGSFSHAMLAGGYRMAGRTVTVTITDKHWVIPWPLVEARLEQLVGPA